jgi:hypothetical protein
LFFFIIHINSFIYHRNIAVFVNLLKITLVVKRNCAYKQQGGATRYVLVITGHESATLARHPLLPRNLSTNCYPLATTTTAYILLPALRLLGHGKTNYKKRSKS